MKNLTTIFLITIPLICLAQPFQREVDTIPVENYGWLLPAPFLGGYNWMTPYMVDIDEDGDYDLFSGEVTGKISFLRNDGTPNMADFNYITNCFDSIQINPQYGGFTSICFYDIDADNDLDMFVSGFFPPPALNSGILFYRNIGNTQNYNFILEDSAFAGIAYISPIYPDFCDIDADGDYDLFMGHSETQYYRNISFYLNTGTPQEPQMELVTHNFASIEEDGIAHPRFCDIDDDGDFDLFVGVGTNFGLGSPYSNGKISFYENIGTPEVYDFDLISTFYDSIYVQDEASPCFADIDNDGDYDLFVGKGDDTAYFAVGSMGGDLVFYQNNGTAADPDFEFITKNYLGIDVDGTTCPRFYDIDADGDLDMFIAHTYNHIIFYRNIGDAQNPYFILENEQYQGIEESYGLAIDFADIDADDDYDLFVSSGVFTSSETALYINQGTPYEADFVLVSSNLIGTLDSENPCLVDIDDDDDYDLFIGYATPSYLGLIGYYENIGNPRHYNFVLNNPSYFNISVTSNIPKIEFSDLDDDSDYDLYYVRRNLLGLWGIQSIYEYTNIGTQSVANFVLTDTLFENILTTSGYPEFCDIDSDGDKDLFIGTIYGGVNFYRNQSNPSPPVLSVTLSYPDVILHWHPIAGAAEYLIYYQDTPYFTPSGIPQLVVLPPNTTYTDSGAINYGKRFYRVVVGN